MFNTQNSIQLYVDKLNNYYQNIEIDQFFRQATLEFLESSEKSCSCYFNNQIGRASELGTSLALSRRASFDILLSSRRSTADFSVTDNQNLLRFVQLLFKATHQHVDQIDLTTNQSHRILQDVDLIIAENECALEICGRSYGFNRDLISSLNVIGMEYVGEVVDGKISGLGILYSPQKLVVGISQSGCFAQRLLQLTNSHRTIFTELLDDFENDQRYSIIDRFSSANRYFEYVGEANINGEYTGPGELNCTYQQRKYSYSGYFNESKIEKYQSYRLESEFRIEFQSRKNEGEYLFGKQDFDSGDQFIGLLKQVKGDFGPSFQQIAGRFTSRFGVVDDLKTDENYQIFGPNFYVINMGFDNNSALKQSESGNLQWENSFFQLNGLKLEQIGENQYQTALYLEDQLIDEMTVESSVFVKKEVKPGTQYIGPLHQTLGLHGLAKMQQVDGFLVVKFERNKLVRIIYKYVDNQATILMNFYKTGKPGYEEHPQYQQNPVYYDMKVWDANGNVYVGEGSKEQMFHGKGRLDVPGNIVMEGYWINGQLMK